MFGKDLASITMTVPSSEKRLQSTISWCAEEPEIVGQYTYCPEKQSILVDSSPVRKFSVAATRCGSKLPVAPIWTC